jgi:hypothetical protein
MRDLLPLLLLLALTPSLARDAEAEIPSELAALRYMPEGYMKEPTMRRSCSARPIRSNRVPIERRRLPTAFVHGTTVVTRKVADLASTDVAILNPKSGYATAADPLLGPNLIVNQRLRSADVEARCSFLFRSNGQG